MRKPWITTLSLVSMCLGWQIISAPAAAARQWIASSAEMPAVRVESSESEPMLFAASEMKRYLGAILGESSSEKASSGGPRIVLTKKSDPKLGDEGYRISVKNKTLRICGGGDAGVVYGVYYFLREFGGCRFSGLGPDSEYVPRVDRIVFPGRTIEMKPKLWYRGVQLWNAEEKELLVEWLDWMAKNGLNYVMYTPVPDGEKNAAPYNRTTGKLRSPGYPDSLWFDKFIAPEVLKRGLKLDRNHHGLFAWLSPAKYFKDHPEYFAFVGGKRVAEPHQLSICTSNDDAVNTMIDNMKSYLRGHPAVKIIGCIPEDGFGMCQCEKCLANDAAAEKDPTPASYEISEESLKSLLIDKAKTRRYAELVNRVAREIRAEFPDVLVGSAAYVDLVWPDPRIRPESNVVTWVAIYWRDGVQVLSPDSPSAKNRAYIEALSQWRKAHKGHVILYEYYMGMMAQRSLPYPQDRVIIRDWPLMKSMGIEGATIQCWPSVTNTYGLDLAAFARSGWEDQVNPEKLQDEYLLGMYGSAADAVKPIYDAFHETWRREEEKQTEMLPGGRSIVSIMDVLSESGLDQAVESAKTAAKTDRELRQVVKLVLMADYWKSGTRVYRLKDELKVAQDKGDKQAAQDLARKLELQVQDALRCFDRLPDGYVSKIARWYWNQELPEKK